MHPTRRVPISGVESIYVDEEIAELVGELLQQGYKINRFSQDELSFSKKADKDVRFVWLEFATSEDANLFVQNFASDNILYYYNVVESWEFDINPTNGSTKYCKRHNQKIDLLPLKLEFPTSIRFPREQLPMVEKKFLELGNSGEYIRKNS